MVKIEFFKGGKSLGTYPLMNGSDQSDRDMVAHANKIEDYDRFILDNGRVHAARVAQRANFYEDDKGFIWMSWEMPKTGEPLREDLKQYPMTPDECYPGPDAVK